jgi:hypothetical protein
VANDTRGANAAAAAAAAAAGTGKNFEATTGNGHIKASQWTHFAVTLAS